MSLFVIDFFALGYYVDMLLGNTCSLFYILAFLLNTLMIHNFVLKIF